MYSIIYSHGSVMMLLCTLYCIYILDNEHIPSCVLLCVLYRSTTDLQPCPTRHSVQQQYNDIIYHIII